MKRMSIKTQYYLGAGIILLICCVGASWYQYQSLQQQALNNVYRKANIFLLAASSIRMYVKDTLRPRIGSELNADQFILEAMSTSYVSRQILNNMKQNYPDFSYKRAAFNPRNPVNTADAFERDMLSWFAENPGQAQWEGMIRKENGTFYARMTPIWAERECLQCHGDPVDAPQELIARYGDQLGYGFSVADIVGADTIYIPMDQTNLLIKERTARVFLFGFVSLFSLFALFALLFNRTVVQQMKQLAANISSIYADEPGDPAETESLPADEFFQVRQAFENVTATLKSVHGELWQSERKYRTLFQASPYTIFVCDQSGRLTDLNRAGFQLLGLDEATALATGTRFRDLFSSATEGDRLFERVREQGFVPHAEHAMVDRSGRQIICVIAVNRLVDESGGFTGIEGVLTDVTEEKKLSKHLAQTERMASIGQLAAGVAHEINNPLGVILCYDDLILKSHGATDQIREDAQVIQKHANSCKSIVESLLNFARVSSTRMKKTDIHQCLEDVMTVLQNQMKKQTITVTTDLDETMETVVIDEDKIRQVFMNLILNSMQAMPDGGELKVTSRMDRQSGEIEIRLSDTGCGIPEDQLERIFEPFYTTKARGEGTGLGLSVSYGIIEQHSGRITVTSRPQHGSTFSIQLPLAGNTPTQQPEAP